MALKASRLAAIAAHSQIGAVVRRDAIGVFNGTHRLLLSDLLCHLLDVANRSGALCLRLYRHLRVVEAVRRAQAALLGLRQDVHDIELVEVGLIVGVQVVTVAHPEHRVVLAPRELRERDLLWYPFGDLAAAEGMRVDLDLIEGVIVADYVFPSRDLIFEDRHNVVRPLHEFVLREGALVELALCQFAAILSAQVLVHIAVKRKDVLGSFRLAFEVNLVL